MPLLSSINQQITLSNRTALECESEHDFRSRRQERLKFQKQRIRTNNAGNIN